MPETPRARGLVDAFPPACGRITPDVSERAAMHGLVHRLQILSTARVIRCVTATTGSGERGHLNERGDRPPR